MKNILNLCLFLLSFAGYAQEIPQQEMEKKAKEMIRVIGLSDKEVYKKFIKENYTEALINKPMRRTLQEHDGNSTTTAEEKPADNIEAKAKMYERLHTDIGNGKIRSMKREGDKINVAVSGENGSNVLFVLTFLKTTPYLIDGATVQMTMDR